ncbi:MAG: ankyrin repeat domain-containing protein [Gammaproteobacteria bacterium]|nr:ankyrin repeat domain-containing protein [Gammaproteobacteria bacterium]
MSDSDRLARAINEGCVDDAQSLLAADPALAKTLILWGEHRKNKTEPLHFVSDAVFNHGLNESLSAELAELLISFGADLNGQNPQEPPLIGAASLGAQAVGLTLVNHGANIHVAGLFGATPLHWAAYTGLSQLARALVEKGAEFELKCTEFESTPLFWAVQGYSTYGPRKKADQVGVVQLLIDAGADVDAHNSEKVSALDRSKASHDEAMERLLLAHGARS